MLTLIIGGSKSGKSEFAENLAISYSSFTKPLFYIATMFPYDAECQQRIEKHRNIRKEKHFTTIECYSDLKKISVEKNSVILLECMSNFIANLFYPPPGFSSLFFVSKKNENNIVNIIMENILHLQKICSNLIIISNNIFSDGNIYSPETLFYQKIFGIINQNLAALANEIYEIVYSIPIIIKKKE